LLKDSIELEAKQNLRAQDQESTFIKRYLELPFKFHDPEFAVYTSALGAHNDDTPVRRAYWHSSPLRRRLNARATGKFRGRWELHGCMCVQAPRPIFRRSAPMGLFTKDIATMDELLLH